MSVKYGPKWCGITKTKFEDGEFVWRQSDYPVPMTIYKWRDSCKTGSWFASTCHGTESDVVSRRKRGSETGTKNCPVCAKEYNINMGPCDHCNAMRASYSSHLTHQQRWYMCLVYYGFDILFINSYIYFLERTKRKMSQKQYRLQVIMSLVSKCQVHGRGLAPSNIPVDQLLFPSSRMRRGTELSVKYPCCWIGCHMPEWIECDAKNRKTCKYCYHFSPEGKKKYSYTYIVCRNCSVALCCSKKRRRPCYLNLSSFRDLIHSVVISK